MRVLFAKASTVYSGRIDAQLSLGDVMIFIRDVERGGDGSCLVMDPSGGLNPRNWAPAGSTLMELPGQMIFWHEARQEKLEIFIEHVYWEQTGWPDLKGELSKMGAEREVSNLIAQDLSCLDDGRADLCLVSREFRTPTGPIDILCRSKESPFDLVAVEVKRRKVTINDCYQLIRYLESLDAMHSSKDLVDAVGAFDEASSLFSGQPSSGLLVAPSLANNAKQFIADHQRLQFVRVSYDNLRSE